ncbi:phenylalanine ammonia-lyase-like protein [Massarina eburnea CBS 473.64]|uniref:Phenylalanine ammonia-lyase-like protein n=1 Tax=Massarina eburnea CBS 473.64 TaxID=1395130 RepID=A0A6A6RNR3_9PLEO|nr:phenylalanine ammonia-lyase-like protein [Massarina eburnea CBS 473.64]
MAAGEFSRLFVSHWRELHEKLRLQDEYIVVDGRSLSLAAVVACARYGQDVVINEETAEAVRRHTEQVFGQLRDGEGMSGRHTSWGSSAPMRTLAIEQIQRSIIRDAHYSILSGETDFDISHATRTFASAIPLSDPIESTSMPESWVRATILIRTNTLAYPTSGVRPILLERLAQLLNFDVIPRVPLRGSNSGVGDLSPLAYIGGVLQGKPAVQAWIGDRIQGGRKLVPGDEALAYAEIDAIDYRAKDGLALITGTSPSSGIACLALHEAICLAATSTVLTAISAEALCASGAAFHPLHSEVRPHPGQMESAINIRSFFHGSKLILDDSQANDFMQRADRYAVRTSAQWIGPVLEDFQLAFTQVSTEINSAVDNPLIMESGQMLHGGNFQAKAVSSAMEKVRQGCQSLGQMLFAQCTELINPASNKGLPAHLVVDEPSQSGLFKGTDVLISALQAELGFLANPVSTHVQFAEEGYQAVNSLALISARYTLTAVDVLTQLAAAHLVTLCQALDLRALHIQFLYTLAPKFKMLTRRCLSECNEQISPSSEGSANRSEVAYDLWFQLSAHMSRTMDIDSKQRFESAMDNLQSRLLREVPSTQQSLQLVQLWHTDCVNEVSQVYQLVRARYLAAPDATPVLGQATKKIYSFVRKTLEVPFVGSEYLEQAEWDDGTSHSNNYKYRSMGAMISAVYEAMRNGALYSVVVPHSLLQLVSTRPRGVWIPFI